MTLEARNVPVKAEDNTELAAMIRRFWLCTALTLPVFILAMTHDILPNLITNAFVNQWLQWFECALATPVVLWGGWPFFQRGWRSVVDRRLNRFTLIALGIVDAWGYSLVALLAPDIFPAIMRNSRGQVAV